MADATSNLNVKFNGDPKGLNNAINQSQRKLNNFQNFLKKIGTVASGIFAYQIFSGFLDGMSNAIESAASYEKQLDKVQAITGSTNLEMEELKNNINEVANSSKFAGVEIGKLAETLGRRGFNADEITDMTKAIRDLAIVADRGLAETGGVIGSVLQSFRLNSDEASEAANVLAEAVTATNLEVNTFGTGIAYVGSVSADLGISLAQTAAMMGVIASSGVKASTAGRGLRQILIQLNNAGLSLNDAYDKVNSASNKVAAATALVGVNFSNQLLTLARNRKEVEELTAKYEDNNRELEKQVEIVGDNLATAWQILTSKVKNFFENLDTSALKEIVEAINRGLEGGDKKKTQEDIELALAKLQYSKLTNDELEKEKELQKKIKESAEATIKRHKESRGLFETITEETGMVDDGLGLVNQELSDAQINLKAIAELLKKSEKSTDAIAKSFQTLNISSLGSGASYQNMDVIYKPLSDGFKDIGVSQVNLLRSEFLDEFGQLPAEFRDIYAEIALQVRNGNMNVEDALNELGMVMNEGSIDLTPMIKNLGTGLAEAFTDFTSDIATGSKVAKYQLGGSIGALLAELGRNMVMLGMGQLGFHRMLKEGFKNPAAAAAAVGIGLGLMAMGKRMQKNMHNKAQDILAGGTSANTSTQAVGDMEVFERIANNEQRWVITGNNLTTASSRYVDTKNKQGVTPD